MAIAARRLGLDHAALARRNLVPVGEMPYRTPSGALYDSGDYEACLDQALELAEYEAIRERAATARAEGRLAGVGIASSSPRSRTWATSRSRRRPSSGRRRCRSRATRRARPSRSIRSEASRCGSERPPRTGSPDGLRAGGCRRARMRTGDVTVLSELDTATTPWTVASGNYSSRFSGVGVGAVQAAARRVRAKVDAIREHVGEPEPRCARWPGWPTGTPRACPRRWSPDWRRSPSGRHRTSIRRMARIASPRRAPTASSSTSAPSRSIARPAPSVTDYVTVHDAGCCSIRRSRTARSSAVSRTGRPALFERHVYDESGNLMTGSLVDYLTPTARPARAAHRAPLVVLAVYGARREGSRRGQHDVRASRDRERRRGRARAGRRGAPATAPRVWGLIHGEDDV